MALTFPVSSNSDNNVNFTACTSNMTIIDQFYLYRLVFSRCSWEEPAIVSRAFSILICLIKTFFSATGAKLVLK